ncbi:MAG: hypothetical protein QM681_08900 [Novosphingobium sp.]
METRDHIDTPSGASAVIAIVVLLSAIVAFFVVNLITGSETATNSAITNAVDSVSFIAKKPGDAASGGKLATLAAIRRAVGE